MIVVIVLLAILADLVSPHSPIASSSKAFLRPPVWQQGGSWTYLLGTDAIGRDMLSRLIHGTRFSLLIGCIVVAISGTVGVALGLVAGFFRGAVGILMMRLMDIVLAMPTSVAGDRIVAVLGPGPDRTPCWRSRSSSCRRFVRVTRAAVLGRTRQGLRRRLAHGGAGGLRLMFLAVLPNCLAPLIVQASLGFSSAILDAAALGFLGLGAQPPTPEWGTMLADALQIRQAPGGW